MLLETPRLTLRAFRVGDVAALRALYRINRDRLADSFPTAVKQMETGGEDYVASKVAEWSSAKGFWYGAWVGDSLIGQIQIKNIDWETQRAELAYLVGRAHEGQGFVSEMMRAILSVCFVGLALHKVFLRTIVGNARSESLARRFGFTHEGVLRQEFLTLAGRRVDLNSFGLLAREHVLLREVMASDVPHIAALVTSVLAEFGLRFGEGSETDAQILALPRSYGDRGGCFWVATEPDGALLGCAGVFPVDVTTVELRKMYLHANARGRGVGKRLLESAVRWSVEQGATRMVLDTVEQMNRAIGFYEANGFVRDDTQIRGGRCTRGYVRVLAR
jgi:putative acetyltransferase